MSRRPPLRGTVRVVALSIALAALFAAGWWASTVIVGTPGAQSTQTSSPLTATVSESTVGRTMNYSATVRQPFLPVATNALAGVVTSVSSADALGVGDAAYVVGDRAVRVVEGTQPFWRDLQAGVNGRDVVQLQDALISLGFLGEGANDGHFGAETAAAVRAWRSSLGLAHDPVIPRGELVAIPTLPQAVSIAPEIFPGAELTGGERSISARTGDVVTELRLSQDQAQLIPPDSPITITYEDRAWSAIIGSQSVDETGQAVLTLTGPDGGAVCGEECAALPPEEEIGLPAAVQVTPAVTGPSVPVTAVRTATDGSQYVILEDGTHTSVSVVGSAGGIAVLDGLDVGRVVRLTDPADSSDSPEADDAQS